MDISKNKKKMEIMGINTIVDVLKYRARYQRNRDCYIYLNDGEHDEARLTYLELDRIARSIASELIAKKLTGKTAMLLFPPGLNYITAFFGCLYAGVIAIPAYPPDLNQLDKTLPGLQAIVDNSQVSFALTDSETLEMLNVIFIRNINFSHLKWIATNEIKVKWKNNYLKPNISARDIAILQYEPEKKGAPNFIKITHENLMNNLSVIQKKISTTSNNREVTWLPPYFDMGLISGILQPLYYDTPVILMSPRSFFQKPVRWLEAITKYKATASGGPNFAYDLCVKKISYEQMENLNLNSWKVAFYENKNVKVDVIDKFSKKFSACGFNKKAFDPRYGHSVCKNQAAYLWG